MEERRRRILGPVDPGASVGLEIGPLASPIVVRSGGTIYYADHLSTEELRARYAPHAETGALALADIVEIDVVARDGERLAAALGARGPVDYVVASHVIEHIPDPIGWLLDIADCLREGGLLCLAVPDKRFTFDHFRDVTRFPELVDAHLRRVALPTAAQVYDGIANVAAVDGAAAWHGRVQPPVPLDGHNPETALATARRMTAAPTYHDVHCTVFTPSSFVDLVRQGMAIGLIPFSFARFEPTRFNESEFLVILRKEGATSAAARAATAPVLDPALHHDLPGRGDSRAPNRWWRRISRFLGLPPGDGTS